VSFHNTLEHGIKRIEGIIAQQKEKGENQVGGAQAFELYDTFGFPYDLTELIAREAGLTVDEKGYEAALQVQKDRSRSATTLKTDDWVELLTDDKEEFIGYDYLDAKVKIVKYRKIEQKKKSYYQLVFNITPFYPEGGGQVGDQGYIEAEDDKVFVFDTKKENNLIVHFVEKLPKTPTATFSAVVDHSKRLLAASNHSATHLLHHALREVLGDHVAQKGSLVAPDYLRFDFSHFSKVSEEELLEIERRVNAMIRQSIPLVEKRNTPIKEAQEMGAMMLFGEKYGDSVRVIQFGESLELCGGTHVQNTGEIGWFKITSEGSVASGIRRIEAISNRIAEEHIYKKIDELDEVYRLLKNPKNVLQSLEDLLASNLQAQKQLEQFEKDQAKHIKAELKSKIQNINGVNFIEGIVSLSGGAIKDVLFQLKGEVDNLFAVIGGDHDGKCTLNVMIAEELVKSRDLHAGNLVRSAAKHIQGGGGGQPFFATAGGKDVGGLGRAISEIKQVV